VSKWSKNQDLIDSLHDWMQGPSVAAEKVQTNGHASSSGTRNSSSPMSDEQVLELCRAAKNAPKFEALFDRGDVHTYHDGDDSGADLALLGIMTLYTHDATQLERIFSSSALGQRAKWRRRRDYRDRTIAKALAEAPEVYQRPRERARPVADLADSPIRGKSAKSASDDTGQGDADESPKLELVTFTWRPAPPPREFVISELVPRYHPTTLYGWGGTAKSVLAVLLGLSVAGRRDEFLGRPIEVHGPVLYLDFELDVDEQHRRVMQLACGLNMQVPEAFKYTSTLGFRTHEAVEFALGVCNEHDVVLAVLDSLGPAMVGDMVAARDVIEFHNCYIAPFKALGVTPILVDHQARQQGGEGYQSKGAFGSAYKEHLSRSMIQVEAGDRSADDSVLNVRLRHKKTNFSALAEPFDVSLSFSDEMIVAKTRELSPADRAGESSLNADERVVAALEDGPAYPDEIAETTGLARSTVKNKINALKKAGRVEVTGEVRGQMERVRLVEKRERPRKDGAGSADLADSPYKGKSAKSTPVQSADSGPDDGNNPTTVAVLFADPPEWLATQLKLYREEPERHFKPLCVVVAATVLGDGLRWEEVAGQVERLA
jgi:DNA-binding transcriptional ArsR family regulator